MTTRPDGQMGIAAAFARVTPRVNKRPRSKHAQDLVTPKPPPLSNENTPPEAFKNDASEWFVTFRRFNRLVFGN